MGAPQLGGTHECDVSIRVFQTLEFRSLGGGDLKKGFDRQRAEAALPALQKRLERGIAPMSDLLAQTQCRGGATRLKRLSCGTAEQKAKTNYDH